MGSSCKGHQYFKNVWVHLIIKWQKPDLNLGSFCCFWYTICNSQSELGYTAVINGPQVSKTHNKKAWFLAHVPHQLWSTLCLLQNPPADRAASVWSISSHSGRVEKCQSQSSHWFLGLWTGSDFGSQFIGQSKSHGPVHMGVFSFHREDLWRGVRVFLCMSL